VICKTGLEFKARQELLRVPEIIEARITFGMYDIVCKIEAPNMKCIRDIIINDIRENGLIKETQTLIL
jgi:DNA-binding Lrp family transcriptional regulator